MSKRNEVAVQFILNSKEIKATVPSDLTLQHYLRGQLRLTGTKNGCGQGQCGACTVIINGKAQRSCLLKMPKVDGRRVETIEGIGTLERLHPLQEAFVELGAVQCGFCTPGLIMTGKALLDINTTPSVEEIHHALSGNLCRCGTYSRVISQDSHVIGENVARKDARLKVTGRTRYADDMHFDGMLYGKILWSAHPHAEILSINTEKAKELPGVHAVLTAEDVPGPNDIGAGQPVLAEKKVRFVGDPVAIVFAETEDLAKRATERIEASYKELEGVFSPNRALQSDAPRIHTDGNLDAYIPFHKGNVEVGFDQADLIVEESYYTPFIEHAYIETESGVASPDGEGGVIIWICTQQPRPNRDIVANCLNLPDEKVRLAETPCGGSFGGKWTISLHALLALGVLYAKRPVKIVLDRQESMRMHLKRNAVHLEYKTGVAKDGRLVALQAKIISDQGAYSPIGRFCLEQMMVFAAGPYVIPNVKIDGYSVYTNKVPGGAMRGFGDNMVAFAMESQMDLMARRLGMDPFDFHIINALDVGQATGGGQVLKASVGIKQCLREAKGKLKKEVPLPKSDKKIGVGVAAAFKNVGGGGASGCIAELTKDGKILIRIECPDIGQGSNTVLAQIAAQTTGVKYEDIEVISGDTHEAPETGFTGAQRVTLNAGNAVLKACQSLKKKIISLTSNQFGLDENLLLIDKDRIVETNLQKPLISLADLGQIVLSESEGEELWAEEYHKMPPIHPLSPTGNTDLAVDPDKYANYPTYSYVVHVAIVEVDEETGKVKVPKVIAVHDVGKALNPQNCESQIEGAILMGLGYALSEEFVIKDGWNITDSLKKCRIPTIREVPEVKVTLVEDPEPLGPFQAKGISEAAIVAITPAIINAIHDAVGVRITDLPANEKKILHALKEKHS
jgi:CO/xanthine dehydrogenase Mo-binding subunit